MEKYIIIFVILATIYYIQTKFKETEGFESVPAQSVGGIDDTNAINTLAQISKQLMVGGVTVPGAMTVTGALTVNGGITTPKGTGYKVTSSNGQSYGIWGGAGSGFATDNGLEIHTYKPDGGWAGNPLNIVGNDTRVNGNLNVGGEIRGNCAADQENGFRFPYHCWMKVARTDGGQDPYKLLYENSGKTVFRSPNGFEFRNPQDQVLYRVDRIHGPQLSELFRITNQQWKYVLFSSDGNALNCNGNGNFDMTWQNNPEYFWYQRGSRIFNYKYPNKCMTITGDRGWNRDTFVNLTDFDPNNAHQCWTWSWAGCIVTSSCSNGEGNPVPALKNGWITKMRCRQDGRIDIWDWNGGADCNFWKW
jgi:hypothetical protein